MLAEEVEECRKVGLEIDWDSVSGYFDRLRVAEPALNIATFVGHGNIRASVIGHDDRPARDDEMRAMRREVEIAMDAGALGVSTGLIYSPGLFSCPEEITDLQKIAAARGGIYSSHVRSEGDLLLDAADEFLNVVEETGCQGQFSHLKASGPGNWGKVERVVAEIEQVNARGGRVFFDKYPYIASSTSLASLLPRWVRDGGRDAALERLSDPPLRGRIVNESAAKNEGKDGWASILIVEAGVPEYEQFQGLTLSRIAAELGRDDGDTFLELLVRSRLTTAICNFTMSQEETDLVLLHPLGMVCTDSSCRAPYGPLARVSPHPRAYGTFGRFFREYVKEKRVITLEAAVAKASALPCEAFGFPDRGRIKEGCFADVLVIDWENYRDRSDFTDPHQYCDGVEAIIVNGVLTVYRGNHTGKRGGRILQREVR
jgi:N-acyl-D-amino-acid deacylase